jgi:Domain of unknown function (DUF6265)
MKAIMALLSLLLYPVLFSQQAVFEQLYVLAGGTWVMKTKKGLVCERWQKISNTELKDQGFKVIGKDTLMVEQVQLIEKEGQVYYIPTVKNQNGGMPVPFKLTEVRDNQFTFSNPEHDYPQFIVYDFVSKDSLHAWVDGKMNGKSLKIDYYYNRMPE